MEKVSGTITSTTPQPHAQFQHRGYGMVVVGGAGWVADLFVQISLDNGATWVNASEKITEPRAYRVTELSRGLLRLQATSFTSGSIPYTLCEAIKEG